MKRAVGLALAFPVMLAMPTMVLAQDTDLTSQQQERIYNSIIKDKSSPSPPPSLDASKGSELPGNAPLYTFPKDIDDPSITRYQYAVTGKQVIVVDPSNRKIISVIGE